MVLEFNNKDLQKVLGLFTGESCVDLESFSKEEITEIIIERAKLSLYDKGSVSINKGDVLDLKLGKLIKVDHTMFKVLINKGFKPVYYTNDDWHESRKCESRLFYKYHIETKELLNSIFNVLDIYNEYFFLLENESVVAEIEVDEFLQEYFLYFYNVDTDNFEIPNEKIKDVLNIIPNDFVLEHCD